MRELKDPDRVDVGVGESFAIALSGNGVGGYLWHLQQAPEAVRLLAERAEPPEGAAAPGAAGTKRFELEAAAAGDAVLRFERRRSWEETPDAVREVVVHAG